MVDIIWGSTTKPVSARHLGSLLSQMGGLNGTLYIGYPVLGTPEGAFPFDALLLSPEHGVIAFDIVEGTAAGEYAARQDNLYAKLQAKLLQYPSLVRRRELSVKISVVTFAPAVATQLPADPAYPLLREETLIPHIAEIGGQSPETFPALVSAIQALSSIRKGRRKRDVLTSDSRGAKLQRLNDSIANLDARQNAAVVETVDGVQRIRGLAGSGKTIVLALKVAYLHAQNPDWRIAVTFNTRSLKGQFERLINSFVIEQTNEEPDWSRISILHSWGSPSSPGIYYNFVRENGATYLDFATARARFAEGKEFQGVCELALAETSIPKELFDAVLVDEAQDLPAVFLQLCYRSLKAPNRLVYAYDELQSLTNASLPPPEELFGADAQGQPLVQFRNPKVGQPRQDIILDRCYRNSRPILATAHALGFGIYREPDGLIQIFDQRHLWLDVGYRVAQGELEDNHQVSLVRTAETSPTFLEEHSSVDDLIVFKAFESHAEQDAWLVSEIAKNIREEELLAEDIIVINPNPLKTRAAVAASRALLYEAKINSALAGVSSSPDVFFAPDTVTFTGIFRAKGNEAAMVYIINADDCYNAFIPAFLTRARNQLFTAMTRSKAWVRVLGVGASMKALASEYERVKANNFSLNFVYPDEPTRQKLRVINRDMTREERSRVSRRVSELQDILGAIDEGDVRIEDLPDEMRVRLQKLLGSK